MEKMTELRHKQGFTLVEAVIASALISIAVLIIYGEMIQSYRVLYHSRAQMSAQELAFDKIWEVYNQDYDSLSASQVSSESTPSHSVFSSNGVVRTAIIAYPTHSEIQVQVWGDPARAVSTNVLVEYRIRRFPGARRSS